MRALLVLVVLVATASAQGNSVQYRVKQDDTLDVIAAEFYGDRAQAKLIVVENKLKKRVQPGQRLKIPVTREITTDNGDTWQSLAKEHLGDEKRAIVLADFNEANVDDRPAVGTPVTIPIQITHTAQENESFAEVAAKYWGDAKQGDMLRRYNLLDKPALEKGESIVVPILKVRVRKPQPLDADAKQRRDDQRKAVADAERALPIAHSAWLAGDFAAVKAALEPLAARVDYLDTAQAIEVDLLLGKAQLAFGASAEPMFKAVLERKPTHTLSAYYESPKVIDAWTKAGGHVSQ